MPFKYEVSDELDATLEVLFKKNKRVYEETLIKIEEIASRDEQTIDFYKNLKYELKEFKRVHIAKSFVLMFKVFKKEKLILFYRFKHHDDVYKR